MSDLDRFWRLLPEYHRRRDVETDGPLHALLAAFAEVAERLNADIEQQYDNWFLETCEDWVVPYIGDAIRYRALHGSSASKVIARRRSALERSLAQRREVANTIRYRRRKGTLGLLEQIARDVAGWPAFAVELRRSVVVTQHVRVPTRAAGTARIGPPNLKSDGAADPLPRIAETRRPSGLAQYGLTQVALYVSRCQAVPVTRAEALCVTRIGPQSFFINPLGIDLQLYRTGDADARILPGPLTRAALAATGGEGVDPALYGEGRCLALWVQTAGDTTPHAVPASRIVAADLRRWTHRLRPGQVALDPERGRLVFHESIVPQRVVTTYFEGRLGEVGASEQPRSVEPAADRRVFRVGEAGPFATVRAALDAWRSAAPADALIEIGDSGTYAEQDLAIDLGPGQTLELRAADRRRPLVRIVERDQSHFAALQITGHADSALTIDGLAISGLGLQVQDAIGALHLRRCSLIPGSLRDTDAPPPCLRIENVSVDIRIEDCMMSAIHVRRDDIKDEPPRLTIADSIVDGGDANAIEGSGATPAYVALTIHRSTIIGRCLIQEIDTAEDCLFTDALIVARRQDGVLRYCYAPADSHAPRRFECAPTDIAPPTFVSLQRGDPGYCQLARHNARDLLRGASDQSELGVFHDLLTPEREANLATRVAEYAPAETDVQLIFVT